MVELFYTWVLILIYSRDLSDSSMTFLPSFGLMSIELIRIENTPTLTEIPSVYSFQVTIHIPITCHL